MCFNFPEPVKNAIKRKKYTHSINIMAKMKIACVIVDNFLYVIDILQENNFVEYKLKDEIITCIASITNKEIEWNYDSKILMCTNERVRIIKYQIRDFK